MWHVEMFVWHTCQYTIYHRTCFRIIPDVLNFSVHWSWLIQAGCLFILGRLKIFLIKNVEFFVNSSSRMDMLDNYLAHHVDTITDGETWEIFSNAFQMRKLLYNNGQGSLWRHTIKSRKNSNIDSTLTTVWLIQVNSQKSHTVYMVIHGHFKT